MCPSRLSCWNSNHQCGSIRRWGLWEVIKSWRWNLHRVVSALIKGIPERSLTLLPPCEDTLRSWLSATGKRSFIRTWPCWPWSGLLNSRTVSNKFLLFKNSHPGWCCSVDWVLACEPKGRWFNSQSGTFMGFGPGPWLGTGERQLINVSLPHWCFSLSLSSFLPCFLK